MKSTEQAEKALDFLRICTQIETGGYGESSVNRGRELDKSEKEVRESALTKLLCYFESDMEDVEKETKIVDKVMEVGVKVV